MREVVTAKQLFDHLSPYDLDRVIFRMPDGLPVKVIYVDTDERGGAVVIVSDRDE